MNLHLQRAEDERLLALMRCWIKLERIRDGGRVTRKEAAELCAAVDEKTANIKALVAREATEEVSRV